MSKLRDFFYQISNHSEHSYDAFRLKVLEYLGQKPAIRICPYVSFGNHESLYVKGRVLHQQTIEVKHDDDLWENLINMYKRFSTHEIKGAELKLSYQSVEKNIVTDEDGYFGVSLEFSGELNSDVVWHHPELELLTQVHNDGSKVKAVASVMVPPHSASFGVISDIDDTILKTHATSMVKMLYETFTGNAKGRKSFAGTSAFYSALQGGKSETDNNPFFYISSSPWNLYDLLMDFIKHNKLPVGPMFLKDYGFTHDKIFTDGHTLHKLKKIKKVLDAYPAMSFILIGDSGQEDADIYHEIDLLYPGRILAIYIRDVGHTENSERIRSVFGKEAQRKVLSESTLEHAGHAHEMGWITDQEFKTVKESTEFENSRDEKG